MNKKFARNRKLRNLLVISAVVLSIFTGLLSGCSTGDSTDKAQSAVKTAEDSVESSTTAVTADTIIMDGFRQLIVKDSIPADISDFITDKLTQVTKEEAVQMVTGFETAQRNYLPELENRFNYDSVLQAGVAKIYKPGLSLADVDAIKDEALKKLLSETLENGYRVETAEGMYFPIIDYAFYTKFIPSVPEDMKDYIALMSAESGKVPAKDGALVIGWDEVLNRALQQEDFLVRYKGSVKAADVGKLLDKYKTFILYGLNNTPLFEYETKAMNDNAKKAYATIVEKGGADRLTSFLKNYLKVIGDNGYKLTDDVDKFRNNARDRLNLY